MHQEVSWQLQRRWFCRGIKWPGGRCAIVDLKYPADAEAFRQEIRAWLEVNAPKGESIAPFDTITVANDAEWQARKD